MSDVFISHVEEDASIVLELALGLEEAGYSTWCYEIDTVPGPLYLDQVGQAIDECRSILLVVSQHSIGSIQVTNEVTLAYEEGKHFIPVLHDINDAEFKKRKRVWRQCVGAATSVVVPSGGVARILPSIISGLKALGIHPSATVDATRTDKILQKLDNLRSHSLHDQYSVSPTASMNSGSRLTASEMPPLEGDGKGRIKKYIMQLLILMSTVAAIAAIVIGIISPNDDSEALIFPDPNLEAAILGAIGNMTTDVYDSSLESLESLEAVGMGIVDLTGLQRCTNLTTLNLNRNQISDFSPISSMNHLENLNLAWNNIGNISCLTELTRLKILNLADNQIDDISPLENLYRLEELTLDTNDIDDINALSSLYTLTKLQLGNNVIVNIAPISNLTGLTELHLWKNRIVEISALSGLTELTNVQLGSNQIEEISPLINNSGLEEGDIVELRNNSLNKMTVDSHIPQLEKRGVTVYWQKQSESTFTG